MTQLNHKFGIRMAGNEQDFEDLFAQYQCQGTFVYVEIGVANAQTFKTLYDICPAKDKFFVAIDIQEGFRCNYHEWQSHFGGRLNLIFPENVNNRIIGNIPNFIILEADKVFKSWRLPIDICFIDGCHGYACAQSNFISVEPFIKAGGYVIFHDTGEPEQGTDFQPHCNEHINVRAAIKDLGLIDNLRPGWRFVKETNGTRKVGGDGNSSMIFQKIV